MNGPERTFVEIIDTATQAVMARYAWQMPAGSAVAQLAPALLGGAKLLHRRKGPAAIYTGDQRAEVGSLHLDDGFGAKAFDMADAGGPEPAGVIELDMLGADAVDAAARLMRQREAKVRNWFTLGY